MARRAEPPGPLPGPVPLSGPLSGPGRWRRLAPFAAVLALGVALSPISPAVLPAQFALALAVCLAVGSAVAWVPWARLPPWSEAGPAFSCFVIFALLFHGSGAVSSGFGPLLLVPVFWLALYHGPRLLVIGLCVAGVVIVMPLLGTNGDPTRWRMAALWLGGGGLVAWTTHRLVRDAKAGAARLAATAEELAAASARAGYERDFSAAVLDTAGFLVVVLDAAGRITVFNRRCEQVTGLAAAEVRGQPFFAVVSPPDDLTGVPDAVGPLAAADFPTEYESDWVGTGGERRTIAWRNTVLADHTGLVTHVIVTGLDVTDQRRTERMFAHVLAAATEQAIVATDRNGVVTVFNAGAVRLLGYPAEEIVGRESPMRWHLPGEIAARAAELGVPPGPAVLRPVDEVEPREWTYVRKDGAHVPVQLNTSVIRDERGEITGYLSVARDVTRDRQSAEALRTALARETAAADGLRQLDRVRTDLVATVSHELRTPLTSILGNVEMLADGDAGPLSGPQARMIAAVERNARRLLALIEDLLMLSRIESGAVKINTRPVAVRTIVGGALEALHSTRVARGVDLQVDLPPESLTVLGDAAQLERVVINLVDNGLKFTPPGGRVRVSVVPDDGYARLVVADTGIGIPADEVDNVFDQFFRSTRSAERASPGTGLGLAITKSIVERHGGRIWARCDADQPGTEVTCLIPRAG